MDPQALRLNELLYAHRCEGDVERAATVWRILVEEHLQNMVGPTDAVLDVGAGYCHFLNSIQAPVKVAVEANATLSRFANRDIEFVSTADLSMPQLDGRLFDFILISNLLEHLESTADVLRLMARVRTLLAPAGRLVILQPNFRLLGAAYFDFIDHRTVLTEKSVAEAVESVGLKIQKIIKRFLPYTMKSRIPARPWMVRLYLRTPLAWALMGKQSLIVAVAPDR